MKKRNSATDYFYGYILVKLENAKPEEMINRCLQAGITMREIERICFTTVTFRIRKSDFGKLKKAIRGTGTRVRILRKYGLDFTCGRMGRRRFFMAGALVFAACMFCLSSFVWRIDIEGNKKIAGQRIIAGLADLGFRTGTFKYGLDLRKIEETMLKGNEQISVIKIDMDGTRAVVSVVERTMPSRLIDKDKHVDIVSRKEGVITRVFAYKGREVVKEGDYVKANQLLISGNPDPGQTQSDTGIRAMGVVLAKTWYEFVADMNLKYKFTVRTGRFKIREYYTMAGKNLKLKNSNINYKKYDKIKNVDYLHLFSLKLPILKTTETYYEKTDRIKMLTEKEAEMVATCIAEKNAAGSLAPGSRVLAKKTSKTIKRDRVQIKILYTVEENISKEILVEQTGGRN